MDMQEEQRNVGHHDTSTYADAAVALGFQISLSPGHTIIYPICRRGETYQVFGSHFSVTD